MTNNYIFVEKQSIQMTTTNKFVIHSFLAIVNNSLSKKVRSEQEQLEKTTFTQSSLNFLVSNKTIVANRNFVQNFGAVNDVNLMSREKLYGVEAFFERNK